MGHKQGQIKASPAEKVKNNEHQQLIITIDKNNQAQQTAWLETLPLK